MPFPVFDEKVKFEICRTIEQIIKSYYSDYPMIYKQVQTEDEDYFLVENFRINMKYTLDKLFLRVFICIKNERIQVYDLEIKSKFSFANAYYAGILGSFPEFETYGYPLFIKDDYLTYNGPEDNSGKLTKSVR